MQRPLSKHRVLALVTFVALLAGLFAVQQAFAQVAPADPPARAATEEPGNPLDALQAPGDFGGLPGPGDVGGFGDFGLGDDFQAEKITLSAAFTAPSDGQPARLFVTAKMAPGWHLYSITQPPGAVKPTKVNVLWGKEVIATGEFVPDQKPEVRKTEVFPVPLEEHYGTVTFSAPLSISPSEDLSQFEIDGELDGMVCHDERGCVPLSLIDTKFVARQATGQAAQDLLARFPQAAGDTESTPPGDGSPPTVNLVPPYGLAGNGYRADDTHVDLRGNISPETVVAGTSATLQITAVSDPDWYVYAYANTSVPGDISSPTRLVLLEPAGWSIRSVGASSAPTEKKEEGFPVVRYHEGSVAWLAEISIPADVPPGQYSVRGLIGYQTCSSVCDRPTAAAFSTTIRVGPQPVPGRHDLALTAADEGYRDVARRADEARQQLASADGATGSPDRTNVPDERVPADGSATDSEAPADSDLAAAPVAEQATRAPDDPPKFDAANVETTEVVEAKSLGTAILFALAGGLILNIMPCVLPVIGLKVLAFFDQAGQSRSRAFWLNVWYSLGLMSVFIALAAAGVALSELFTKNAFGIVMAVVVFAMALSLMGLWELRVPSFLGGSGAQKLTQQEGVLGAFFKGVITTLLAIPCGAPLLSPALTWADEQVRNGAPQNVYLVFSLIGVGMALPYLIIGAFPELLRFLPKPGMWMETFKKSMGYFLLLAVVWILYFVPREDVVATVALLFAVWFACWMIGRLPITANTESKVYAWVGGLVVVALTYVTGFHLLLRPAAVKQIRNDAQAAVYAGDFDEAVMQRFVLVQTEQAAQLAASASSEDPNGSPGEPSAVVPPAVLPVGIDTGTSAADEAGENAEKSELPWQPFGRARFEALVGQRKTILVDFTADWCLTCKALEASVLNTQPIREFVDKNGVITLKADWTRGDEEITKMLEILGGKQVPVVAIFPAGKPNQPIVLRGWYTHDSLLDALKKAGPSAGVVEKRRTAMRVP